MKLLCCCNYYLYVVTVVGTNKKYPIKNIALRRQIWVHLHIMFLKDSMNVIPQCNLFLTIICVDIVSYLS